MRRLSLALAAIAIFTLLAGAMPTARAQFTGPAPQAGEHTGELLAEAGYSADEMGRLRAEGVVA